MMQTYQLVNDFISGQPCSVSLLKDGIRVASIPLDESNTDYQAYLKWVEEGNTPLPADQ